MLPEQMNGRLPPGVKSLDAPLTMAELAAILGRRRGGRPTNKETVRGWCLQGINGVVMESFLDVCVRMTTYGAYLRFRQRVEQVKSERRRRCREAVRQASPGEERRRQRRTQKAIEELKKANAL